VLLAAVLSAPLVLVLVALPAAPPERDQLFGAQPELTVVASAGPFTPGLRVTVVVTAAPAEVVAIAPSWTGTVTRVLVAPGTEVRTGTPVVEVDGVARPYVSAERPFWRPLGLHQEVGPDGSVRSFPGPSGADVDQLHRFLADQGLYTGRLEPGTPFGSATAAAVRELARRLGDGANPGVFAPGMVVWGLRGSFLVGEVEAAVGQPVPGPGAPLLAVAGARYSVNVTDDTGGAVSSEGREGWRFVADPLDVALGDLVAGRLPPGLVPEGGDLRVEGRVEGPVVDEAFRLPPAALVVDGERTCVVAPTASGAATVEVQVVGATSGQVVVTGLADGDELVANPAAARGIVRC
jgi:hypothetical protein